MIMASLFGFPPKNAEAFAKYVYNKFGARPNLMQISIPFSSPSNEFFMALYYFSLNWAYQYQATVPVTFMPEAWPGMLLQVPSFNFQGYITTVTHSFMFGEDGFFETQINTVAPALLKADDPGAAALIGLPLAGGYIPDTRKLPTPGRTAGQPHKPVTRPPVTRPSNQGGPLKPHAI
jgi:hypothetical protein